MGGDPWRGGRISPNPAGRQRLEVAGSPERPDLTGFGRAATVGGSQVALGGDEQSGGGARVRVDGGGAQVRVDGSVRGFAWFSSGVGYARCWRWLGRTAAQPLAVLTAEGMGGRAVEREEGGGRGEWEEEGAGFEEGETGR